MLTLIDGRIAALNSVSAGAAAMGRRREDYIGKSLFDAGTGEAEALRERHRRCAKLGEEQTFVTKSTTAFEELWQVRYIPVAPCCAVLVTADKLSDDMTVLALSHRDHETLRLLVADRTVPEIADQLGVSPQAIHNKISTLRAKFGRRTLHGLVAAAVGAGVR